ncbi:MAG TPA: hypothetical protein DCG47_00315 [Spirochaetaceae bacterium]|jgi:PAS domain S-box-containing protein|nr:hypothetical protein [Spirochaetaceae bacterium]
MAKESIRRLHAKIAATLRWGSVFFLIMLLSFLLIFIMMSRVESTFASQAWRDIFIDRLAQMENIADGSSTRNPAWIIHTVSISTEGVILSAPIAGMTGLRLNAAGFFGRIHGLAPGKAALLFFPDLVDGIQRVHFIKRSGAAYIVLSMEPKDFFPLPLAGHMQLSIVTDGIIWYADNPDNIGNVSRSSSFFMESKRLYASVGTPLPSMPDSRLLITQDISLRFSILIITVIVFTLAFWLLILPIRGLPSDFSALQNEHSSLMGMIQALSRLFSGMEGDKAPIFESLAHEIQTILSATGLQAFRFEENDQYQALVKDLGNTVSGLVGRLVEDKERLDASEKRFRAFIEQSPLSICIIKGSALQYANPKFLLTFGITADEDLGAIEIPSLFAQEEQEASRERIRRHELGLAVPNELESLGMRRNGSAFPVYIASSAVDLPEGNALIAIIIDISERKRAEEGLKASLREKEVLLRELYHRTRNNMNVIMSMMSLQAEYTGDKQIKASCDEAKTRIQAMALVHQKLYDAKDLSHINLKDYIDDLIVQFARSQGANYGQVRFETKMDDVLVLIDTAIPCGLVLSELISNSLKHAFPGGRAGVISIELSVDSDKSIRLLVADDGIGLAPGFDPRTGGKMGLAFMYQIAEAQLAASVSMKLERGVSCELTFKDNHYQARV